MTLLSKPSPANPIATILAAPDVLTGEDRCDRCGARGLTKFVRPAEDHDLTLLLCAHHAKTHEAVLIDQQGFHLAVDIRDRKYRS